MVQLTVNGEVQELDVAPDTPLLWVLRENLGLTGAKFGCGISLCGACTVHLDGAPVRACVTPVSAAQGRAVTTIEGIADNGRLHPVQQAWIDEQAPQCGYCQSGQIMSAVALLRDNPNPDDATIDRAMSGNVCRCGAYPRIRKGIKRAAGILAGTTAAGTTAAGTRATDAVAVYTPTPTHAPAEPAERDTNGVGENQHG